MWRPIFFSLVAVALSHALVPQVPFSPGQGQQDERFGHPVITTLTNEDLKEWNINNLSNDNATDHLVFETVYSLLQHWPNTRMRNGHNVVPGTIPKGTLLYHGCTKKELPTHPEWLATDPEHSYLFSRDMFNRSHGGWLLTYVATRPLKVVYFDGSSAVKFPYGSLDTQDLIAWGAPSANKGPLEEEAKRIQDLCRWGKNFGVDGFVRMEMDFEIMYCDFTSGLSVTSFEHLSSEWSGRSSSSVLEMFESINSGAWHNHFPGETRIHLDLPGMISFYDTQLAPSLVPIRTGQERWDHRAINVSSEELATAKARLESSLMRPDGESSGIDWKTLIQVVVDRYAQRLELTRYLLNSSATDPAEILDLAKKAQTQLRIMLTPYLLFSAVPTDLSAKEELDWTIGIYKLCATAHTRSMDSRFGSMTDSEKSLLRAVQGTSREICRVVTKMWAAGVYAGIDPSLNTKESPHVAEVVQLRDTWADEVNRLMAWLDWSVWVKCNPSCGVEEMCYLPTWPVGFPWMWNIPPPSPFPTPDDDVSDRDLVSSLALRTMAVENLADEMRNVVKVDPDEWIRPQPKCIRRLRPYTF